VHLSVGNGESALPESTGPTGKRSARKRACSVWSGGKAAKPYLSLPGREQSCPATRRLDMLPFFHKRERVGFQCGVICPKPQKGIFHGMRVFNPLIHIRFSECVTQRSRCRSSQPAGRLHHVMVASDVAGWIVPMPAISVTCGHVHFVRPEHSPRESCA
jgi:hypothetical protein